MVTLHSAFVLPQTWGSLEKFVLILAIVVRDSRNSRETTAKQIILLVYMDHHATKCAVVKISCSWVMESGKNSKREYDFMDSWG